MGGRMLKDDQSPGLGSQQRVDPRSGPPGARRGQTRGKGLTLPRQVLLAVLRLLGDPHLGQDESGSVPDLGNRDMRAGPAPRPPWALPAATLTL